MPGTGTIAPRKIRRRDSIDYQHGQVHHHDIRTFTTGTTTLDDVPPSGVFLARRCHMFDVFAIPLSWTELIKRTVKEFTADTCLGLAAQLAY
jgi:hypothetical protein